MRSTSTYGHRRGFTLVELAIVVAIAGLLFAGLWRLMSSGSQQLREQAAANQQQQLISAVKAFMASSEGQTWLMDFNDTGGAHENLQLNLPPDVDGERAGEAGCAISVQDPSGPAAPITANSFCRFLPPGFHVGSQNPFGQTYTIRVRRNDGAASGTAANSYDFMIVTNEDSDPIPDTSGGRIAALLGGEGGFVYSNDNVCGTPEENWACGAFGGFSQALDAYGFTNGEGGRIGTYSFVSATTDTVSPWLARTLLAGDSTLLYNTVDCSGCSNFGINMNGNNLYMNATATGSEFTESTNGGTIYLAGGQIFGDGTINITGAVTVTQDGTTPMVINGDSADPNDSGIIVNDANIVVSGQMSSNAFVYTSDARMKHDIKPIDNALEKLLQVRGVSFRWNQDNRDDLGLVAQNVEQVFPELIGTAPNNMKGVEYGNMIAPIIEALRELKGQNDELKATLAKQDQEIKSLKSQLRTREN